MAISATISKLGAYSVPVLLLAASTFFQLVVIPRSYPPNHYDVLGIKRYSTIEEVTAAYERLSSKWNIETDSSTVEKFKIQYAFELLTNPLWKRDYDIFGIDEQIHVLDEFVKKFAGVNFSDINLPLLEATSLDSSHAFDVFSSENFWSKLDDSKALMVQVCSHGSSRCAQFSSQWKGIANLLDGVANFGMVEIGDVQLATYLAEKKYTGEPFFRDGLPSLVAFPPGCRISDCIVRYNGELSADAVSDWFATNILNLPRILYYSKESLVQNFLGKSPHKVKVIFISKTGQRATPTVRQTAKTYWSYASFAFSMWREEEAVFWSNTFGVEDAPAIVILKDPGVKPVVYHGPVNNSRLIEIMEQNKHQVLPQLRSVTSMELGCDPHGYSRAGVDTEIWYCAIVVGRLSRELQKMRDTMRRVQELLSSDNDLEADKDQLSAPAAIALKEKRLTVAWLDGEAQNRFCLFYVNSEDSYETCGTRKAMTDVPKLFIVRYKRNSTEVSKKDENFAVNMIFSVAHLEVDPTSQLVALYKGLDDPQEIIKWISEIIRDGDSRDLPFHTTRTPALVPEDADPIWSRGTEKILSSGKGVKLGFGNMIRRIYDLMDDPRVGPILLLGALMSFGGIYLLRNQSTHPNSSNDSSQNSTTDATKEAEPNKRRRPKRRSDKEAPPSLTDMEPPNAVQMPFGDSDSE